jgi:hypothetical protein
MKKRAIWSSVAVLLALTATFGVNHVTRSLTSTHFADGVAPPPPLPPKPVATAAYLADGVAPPPPLPPKPVGSITVS